MSSCVGNDCAACLSACGVDILCEEETETEKSADPNKSQDHATPNHKCDRTS